MLVGALGTGAQLPLVSYPHRGHVELVLPISAMGQLIGTKTNITATHATKILSSADCELLHGGFVRCHHAVILLANVCDEHPSVLQLVRRTIDLGTPSDVGRVNTNKLKNDQFVLDQFWSLSFFMSGGGGQGGVGVVGRA